MPALIAELASTLLVEAAARFILDVTFALCTHDDTRALFTAVCVCLRPDCCADLCVVGCCVLRRCNCWCASMGSLLRL
jgi:hypothetical protein